jgi:hypothetical protein
LPNWNWIKVWKVRINGDRLGREAKEPGKTRKRGEAANVGENKKRGGAINALDGKKGKRKGKERKIV